MKTSKNIEFGCYPNKILNKSLLTFLNFMFVFLQVLFKALKLKEDEEKRGLKNNENHAIEKKPFENYSDFKFEYFFLFVIDMNLATRIEDSTRR